VKLVDFGIAKAADSSSETRAGVVKGKVGYLAPEQVRSAPADRRADLFAAGVMLAEAMSGQRFWGGAKDVEILQRLRTGDLPPLPMEPPALVPVLERALAVRPEDRHQDAAELRDDLETWLEATTGRIGPREIGSLVAERFADDRAKVQRVIESRLASGAETPAPEVRVEGTPTLPPRPSEPRVAPGWAVGAALAGVFAVAGVASAAAWLAMEEEGAVASGGCDQPDKPRVEVTGDIERDAVLGCESDYVLRYVTRVRPGVTLTIAPGTTLLGDPDTVALLVVMPGGRLVAEGRADAPIVFTSALPPVERSAGDWGGLLLLGRAPTNVHDANGLPTRGHVEGLTSDGEYGGADPEDSSGVLRYVRIEHAGHEIAPNNESNGLTLAGVGRGTSISYVQVVHAADDCFEFFGGTVDAHHLVCDDAGDDGFDWDYGYTGRLQFLLFRDRGEEPSNGLEGDNDPAGTDHAPVSAPRISNVTLCGSGAEGSVGALWRRRSGGALQNALIVGFPEARATRDEGTAPVIEAVVTEAPGVDCQGGFAPPSALPGVQPGGSAAADPEAAWVGAFRDVHDRWTDGWTR
jgi:hypothetical protein